MKKKLTENQLKTLISKSINEALSEISWQKADDAARMARDNDNFETVIWHLEEALDELDEKFERFNDNDSYGVGGEIQRKEGMGKYFKETATLRGFRYRLQKLFEEMKAYNDRKVAQQKNLENLADEKFREEHNGQNKFDYEMNIPDENLDDKQKEFYNHEYGHYE